MIDVLFFIQHERCGSPTRHSATGQQARQPYTPEQVVKIFGLMHRLGGERGLMRQSEFFLYSEFDRKAVGLCHIRNVEKRLNRTAGVAVGAHSGAAEISRQLRRNRPDIEGLSKSRPPVARLAEWVKRWYAARRVTSMADEGLSGQIEAESQASPQS